MKVIFKILPLLFVFAACEVVELDSPNNNDGTDNSKIGKGNIEATDSITFRTKITGTTNKSWVTNEFTLADSDNLTFCRLDDQLQFNADGTYRYDGGNQLCGSEDNQRIKTGTWELSYNSNAITFDKGTSKEYSAEVIALTENEIRLKGNYFNFEVRGKYTVQ